MKKVLYIFAGISVVAFLVHLAIEHAHEAQPEFGRTESATEMMNKHKFNEADGKAAILTVQKQFGTDMAKIIERIMREETAHFKSGQYQLTGSAGMEKGKWDDLPENVNYVPIKDNQDGHIGQFIVWNSPTDFAIYLAKYIKRHNGDWARWNSTDDKRKKVYASRVNSIKNRFV